MRQIWELFKTETILLEFKQKKKEQVIEALIDTLVKANLVTDKKNILDSVLRREEMMSTGIGEGVAIPHSKFEFISQPLLAFGRSSEGIKFDSLDGKKVQLVLLLLSPKDDPAGYVKVLGKIARLLDDSDLRKTLLKAKTSAEIIDLFKNAETNID